MRQSQDDSMDNIAKLTPTGTELLKSGNGRAGTNLHGKPSKTQKILATETSPQFAASPPKPTAEPKPPLKIALVGTAPSSRDLAPFKDPSWTIWACSPGNAHGVIPRADAWFEVHSNLMWPEAAQYGPQYIEWLKQQTFPIYMQDNRLVPNATPLPIQELVGEFGKFFFTS